MRNFSGGSGRVLLTERNGTDGGDGRVGGLAQSWTPACMHKAAHILTSAFTLEIANLNTLYAQMHVRLGSKMLTASHSFSIHLSIYLASTC
jgi:hypothetical protein